MSGYYPDGLTQKGFDDYWQDKLNVEDDDVEPDYCIDDYYWPDKGLEWGGMD